MWRKAFAKSIKTDSFTGTKRTDLSLYLLYPQNCSFSPNQSQYPREFFQVLDYSILREKKETRCVFECGICNPFTGVLVWYWIEFFADFNFDLQLLFCYDVTFVWYNVKIDSVHPFRQVFGVLSIRNKVKNAEIFPKIVFVCFF